MAEEQEDIPSSPDVHFEPVVKLPLVEIKTLEEEEEVMFKMRAKLFRYDTNEQPPEWKERGIGDVKILKHKQEKTVRILMRRDKTLKVCANHYIQPHMELKPNNTSDRAWVWNTLADFADEEPKPELLAIKFANAENAQKFKAAFDEAKKAVVQLLAEDDSESEEEQDESLTKETAETEESEKSLDTTCVQVLSCSSVAEEEQDESLTEETAENEESEKSPLKKSEAKEKADDSVAEKLSKLSVEDKPSEVPTEDKECTADEEKK